MSVGSTLLSAQWCGHVPDARERLSSASHCPALVSWCFYHVASCQSPRLQLVPHGRLACHLSVYPHLEGRCSLSTLLHLPLCAGSGEEGSSRSMGKESSGNDPTLTQVPAEGRVCMCMSVWCICTLVQNPRVHECTHMCICTCRELSTCGSVQDTCTHAYLCT